MIDSKGLRGPGTNGIGERPGKDDNLVHESGGVLIGRVRKNFFAFFYNHGVGQV